MARHIKVAAAQMGPNNEDVSREEIAERMMDLLRAPAPARHREGT